MSGFVSYLLLTLYTLTVVGVILIIISENRNPLKSMPWLIVLLLAPFAGLVLYFFFGHNLSKHRSITRRMRKRLRIVPGTETPPDPPQLPQRFRPLGRLLTAAHALPRYGTRFECYADGRTKMSALLQAVAAARRHIHLQYYIIDDDRTGNRLREALIRKAREGVKVRILYDDVGSRSVRKAFFESMRAEGIEVRPFLHVQFPRFTSKVNYRNHRKIAVIDGCVGFIGGMNIADRYLYGTERLGPWRDTHFRLEGGGVAGLQAAFLNDWYATTRERLASAEYYPACGCDVPNILHILPSGPFGKWRSLLQAVCLAVSRAQQRIWIETPYYLPSDTLNNALQTAALSGIDVRLMMPLHSDSKIVDLAAHSYIDDMLRAGVKVYFYTAGFLHAKQLLIDDELAVIGSANMDFRSFEHNFEINAFVCDRPLVAQLARLFERDMAQSHALGKAEWFHRSRLRRLSESILRLFSPLL